MDLWVAEKVAKNRYEISQLASYANFLSRRS
jgi:hypothetical protein